MSRHINGAKELKFHRYRRLHRPDCAFDDTVDRFRNEILLSAEQKVAASEMPVRYAFRLRSTVAQLERVADHSTNIAEQVIYLRTGKTVRHLPDGWTSPTDPA